MNFVVKRNEEFSCVVSKEYLNYINHFLGNQCIEVESGNEIELNLKKFKFWVDRIIEKIGYLVMSVQVKDNTSFYNAKLKEILAILDLTTEELQKITYAKAKDVTDKLLDKCLKTNDFKMFDELIRNAVELKRIVINIRKRNDIINGKDEILKNIEALYGEEADKYKVQFLTLINEEPFSLEEVLSFIGNLNNSILQDYKDNAKLDSYKAGENFSFIGHSVGNLGFTGDFKDNLVSASLFSEELTKTYKNAYGFVLAPDYIISADTSDLYTANWTQDKDEMYQAHIVTSLPIFKPRERLLTETKDLNEVILDKFEPLGIFCFSTGAKELDSNYALAHKLKESYPNLEVYDIDLTLYKDEKTSLALISDIIKKIEMSPEAGKLLKADYNLFLEAFLKLKKQTNFNYDVYDIIDMHTNLSRMLKSMSPKELFAGDFTDEEIKYIILNNRFLGIKSLLGGDISVYILERILAYFYDYRDNKVIKEIPGFNEFLEVLNKVTLTDEIILLMTTNKEYSFMFFTEILKDFSKKDKSDVLDEYQALTSKKVSLEEKKNNLVQDIALQEEYAKVLEYESFYYLTSEKYNYQVSDLRAISKNDISYLNEEDVINLELGRIKAEIKILQNHKFINRNKIKGLLNQVKTLRQKLSLIKRLRGNNNKLKEMVEREKNGMADCFFKRSGISLDTYPKYLEKATENYDENMTLEYHKLLGEINEELAIIKEQIQELEASNPWLLSSIDNFSK